MKLFDILHLSWWVDIILQSITVCWNKDADKL